MKKKVTQTVTPFKNILILITFVVVSIVNILWATDSHAQSLETKVDINFSKGQTLVKAIEQLRTATKIKFSYDPAATGTIVLNEQSFKQEPLSKILLSILKGTNLTYKEQGATVVIYKETSPNVQAGQGPGTLKGRIVEFESSQPLPGASVYIVELQKGMQSNNDGYYKFSNVPAGKYTLKVTFISYKTESVQVEVKADKEETYDVKMQGSNALQEVVVSSVRKTKAPVSHTTDRQVLEEVKQASVVMSAISSEQISKSADRNAAEAIQRVSGVTVADDRFVVVRGLNQRYNLTYLNDNVAPSTEVNSRAFALDLIPSRIIDKILIYKSAQPENQADATGGVVKIYTKDAKSVKHFDIEIQTGVRENSTFNSNFLIHQGGKWDFLGFDDGTRKLPSAVPGYGNAALATLKPSEYAKAFSPNLTYGRKTALPNLQLTANYYNSFKFFGKQLSSLSSLSYKNDLNKSQLYRQQGNGPNFSGAGSDRLGTEDRNISLVQLNLLQNFTLKLRDSSILSFKNFLLQQGQSNTIIRESRSAFRPAEVFEQDKDIILSYNQRFLYAGNLGGSHYYDKGKQLLKWNAGYTYSNQQSPDQRVIRLTAPKSTSSVGDTSLLWRARGLTNNSDNGNPVARKQGIISRTWTKSSEGVYNLSADYLYNLNKSLLLKIGTFQQYKIRELYRRVFTIHEGDVTPFTGVSHGVGNSGWYINPALVRFREQEIPSVWSEQYFRDDYSGLRVNDNTSGSDTYQGTEQNNSGYVAFNLKPVKDKLEIYTGVRYEFNRQKIGASIPKDQPLFINTPILVDNPTHSWLPSINITYRPASNWAFRAAYGKTVNRTEFREVSPFQEYDFENNSLLNGNPLLKSAKVNNYDARLEFYPQNNKKGETISVGVFYKQLSTPIERINSSDRVQGEIPIFSYRNAKSATIKGVEVEIRKSLDFIPSKLFRDLSVIANLTLIKSETINDTTLKATLTMPTTDKRPLQGQAPYIFNAGLYYDNAGSGTRMSVIYNVAGTSLYAAGRGYVPNDFIGGPGYRGSILELPRHLVDISVTQRLINSLQLKLGVQNLLNQAIRFAEDYNFSNKYEPQNGVAPIEEYDPQKVKDNISSSFKPGRYFIITFSYSL